MDEPQRERPAPFGEEKLSDAFVCVSAAAAEEIIGGRITAQTPPYKVMGIIDRCPIVGDLQSSAVNGAASTASLILLGVMLATLPVPAAIEDPNVPGIRDLGPKPLETPPAVEGMGGTVPEEPEGSPADAGAPEATEGGGEPLPEAPGPEKASQEQDSSESGGPTTPSSDSPSPSGMSSSESSGDDQGSEPVPA